MNDKLKGALQQAKEQAHPEAEWVFPNRRTGRTYTRRPKLLKRLCRDAGVRVFQWRGLRKAAATEMLRSGIDVRTISDLLGHTSIDTTMRYLGVDDTRKREAVEGLK